MMIAKRALPFLLLPLALSACTTMGARQGIAPAPAAAASAEAPIPIKIIAFNDFHGNLPPPHIAITLTRPDGTQVKVPAGGAAYFVTAMARLRAQNPLNVTVSAGDMTSASPLVSSLFLDEPTVRTMNMAGVELNAVGNHEFDRGQEELLRLQNGGCAKFTTREPCQVMPDFPGASYRYLAANVARADGSTLFPPYFIKSFTRGATTVRIGFIGMTLKGTGEIVAAAGIQGLHFEDEAATANALIPRMKAEGADIIVVLIHQGGSVTGGHGEHSCDGLSGDIMPVLDALDPQIQLVISGHTHRDYICDYAKIRPGHDVLLTSAGQYGTLLTDIDLMVDPVTKRIVSKHAENIIVQGEPFEGSQGPVPMTDAAPAYPADPQVAALVARYKAASDAVTDRVVGRVAGPVTKTTNDAGEQAMGDLIADSMLAAMRPIGGAQLAFMNQGGVRAELVPGPGGAVTYGALYRIQPFGNQMTVKSYSGQQLLDLLEEQFTRDTSSLRILLTSGNFRYSYDKTRPERHRVSDVTLDGKPLDPRATYRVAISTFLGDGADGFTIFKQGTNETLGGPLDLEVLEAYFKASATPVAVPELNRIRRLDPVPAAGAATSEH